MAGAPIPAPLLILTLHVVLCSGATARDHSIPFTSKSSSTLTLSATTVCQPPKLVKNAKINPLSYKVNSHIRYLCQDGYKRQSGTSNLAICMFDSTTKKSYWKYGNISCIQIERVTTYSTPEVRHHETQQTLQTKVTQPPINSFTTKLRRTDGYFSTSQATQSPETLAWWKSVRKGIIPATCLLLVTIILIIVCIAYLCWRKHHSNNTTVNSEDVQLPLQSLHTETNSSAPRSAVPDVL